ncbi:MAG: hypothetical protein IKH30_13580 [Clostridia bacterium]|nr:hypothetical protein [Clostridia bacterium]
MTDYEKKKEQVREEAIDWQHDFANHNYSYEELAEWREYFYKLAKRYGLIQEFQENGII